MRSRSGWTQGASLYSLVVRQTFGLQGAVVLLGLALPPLAVLPLHLQERLIDEAIPAGDLDLLLGIALVYAAAMLAMGAIKFAVTWLRGWIDEIVARMLRAGLIDAQRHRGQVRAHRALGAVTSAVNAEVEPLGGFAAEAINTPLIQGGTMLGLVGFMAYTEPALALIGISALVLEAVVTPLVQERINRLTGQRIVALRRAGLDLIEGADPGHHAVIVGSLHRIRLAYRLRLRQNLLKAGLKVFNNLVGHAGTIAIFAVGGAMVIRGETQLGIVVAFLSGMRELRGPWDELIDFYRRFADARIKYRLVVSALNGGAA